MGQKVRYVYVAVKWKERHSAGPYCLKREQFTGGNVPINRITVLKMLKYKVSWE